MGAVVGAIGRLDDAEGGFAPSEQQLQANALFALKATGEPVKGIRGFLNRELFLERIEHMTENATYTSVYPAARRRACPISRRHRYARLHSISFHRDRRQDRTAGLHLRR
jgi:hypothetical protein